MSAAPWRTCVELVVMVVRRAVVMLLLLRGVMLLVLLWVMRMVGGRGLGGRIGGCVGSPCQHLKLQPVIDRLTHWFSHCSRPVDIQSRGIGE